MLTRGSKTPSTHFNLAFPSFQETKHFTTLSSSLFPLHFFYFDKLRFTLCFTFVSLLSFYFVIKKYGGKPKCFAAIVTLTIPLPFFSRLESFFLSPTFSFLSLQHGITFVKVWWSHFKSFWFTCCLIPRVLIFEDSLVK